MKRTIAGWFLFCHIVIFILAAISTAVAGDYWIGFSIFAGSTMGIMAAWGTLDSLCRAEYTASLGLGGSEGRKRDMRWGTILTGISFMVIGSLLGRNFYIRIDHIEIYGLYWVDIGAIASWVYYPKPWDSK